MNRVILCGIVIASLAVNHVYADGKDVAKDVTADRTISAPELQSIWTGSKAKRTQVFKALDVNADGVLVASEVADDATWKRLDINGNGKVPMGEYNAALVTAAGQVVGTADANADGTITSQEAGTAAHTKTRKIRGK